eukprot:Gb_35417 [translate_table: standard]
MVLTAIIARCSLLCCQCSFLRCAHSDSHTGGIQTVDQGKKGLIIRGWAPQLLILLHGAIEQSFNSKLLVEYLGIGIQLCVDLAIVPDDEDVKRAVTKMLGEEEGKGMRNKAQEIRKLTKKLGHKEDEKFINESRYLIILGNNNFLSCVRADIGNSDHMRDNLSSLALFEKVSIQGCQSTELKMNDNFDRLGEDAIYAFIYPNFMINRYGPWMDTNLVLPLGTSQCQVIFDYFLEASHRGVHGVRRMAGKHVEGNEAMAMSGASQVKTAGPLNDEHIKCQGCFAYSFPGVGGIYFQIKHRTIVSIQNEEPSH